MERKAADFTNSAERLVNPPEIKTALDQRQSFTSHIANLKALLEAYPEWAELQRAEQGLADHDKHIRELIDRYGSYQDLEQGLYAVKYCRISKSYDAQAFKDNYPKEATLVIEESVNVKALEGLIKGGLLFPDELLVKGITQETVGYAYVVR